MAQNHQQSHTATLELAVAGRPVRVKLTVPPGRIRPIKLLPQLQILSNALVGAAVEVAEAKGEHISCRAGCGACCRQFVPITTIEAHHLRRLVERMPQPRKQAIKTRFQAAQDTLQAAGLLDQAMHFAELNSSERTRFGLAYFQQHIPCPFLEQESCSIHPDRPISCREYLVTSPAEHCAKPSADTVKCVDVRGKVSNALARFLSDKPRWIPLVSALNWAAQNPDRSNPRLGKTMLGDLLGQLLGKSV